MKKFTPWAAGFWLLALVLCWAFLPVAQLPQISVIGAMLTVTTVFGFAVGLRYFFRKRSAGNIASLLEREVDRTQARKDKQALREGLKHALHLLRTPRSAGGGGANALLDLPWYLVMGNSAAGKTSLLTASGLSASVTEGQPDEAGCDWYFSPDAVLIDTAGQYLDDDQAAGQFVDFLKRLKTQRSRPAINGLVLVVSLPDLIKASPAGREALARRLVARINECAKALGSCPPIYLMLSKTDLMPGFDQAFSEMGNAERQQPLGMTFDLTDLQHLGLRAVFKEKFAQLVECLNQHIDARIIAGSTATVPELLHYANAFADLSSVLVSFVEQFKGSAQEHPPLLLRGLYFTSALQTGETLPALHDNAIKARYALAQRAQPEAEQASPPKNSKSYFIGGTFRRLIFPDRNLSLHHAHTRSNSLVRPVLIGLALVLGAGALVVQGIAFQQQRLWLTNLALQLSTLEQAPDRDVRLRAGEGLEALRQPLTQLDSRNAQGLQRLLGGGFAGEALQAGLQQAYLQQLNIQALEPIGKQLQVQLRELNEPGQSLDAYNALKLYLILTQPALHPDADFMATQLPEAWRKSAAIEGHPVTAELMADNTVQYLHYLRAGQAPALRRNDQVVVEARQRLKTFMTSDSLVDREYLRLQLESARQYPALTLADIVPLPGRQQLFAAEAVPAFFSRQGLETFVKPELIKLLTADLHHENDWVLDGEGSDSSVQKTQFLAELMTRYKTDYAQAWSLFLSGAGLRHFTNMENASQRLTGLSDVQNSPVKTLLAAVNHNTAWDLPAKTDTTQPADALQLALPTMADGSLAKRFEPIARLFATDNAEGADSTLIDRYLANLRKLKVRLTNIQRSQDVGKTSKRLISETLEGQPTEITTARNYVETSLDTSQGQLSRSLHTLFNAPIQYTWETLRDPAGQHIAKAWTQQIAQPWKQVMAHRYPMVASRNEASVKDLQRFVHPESGLLPTFQRAEIGNLAGGEGLGMSSRATSPPLVHPRMVNSIDKASALGRVIASLSDRENGFEVMLDPASNYTDILFTLDGKVLHYRNGKNSWSRFTWPGTTESPGARLDVVTLAGERITVFDYPGRWGLLKMNDSAKVTALDEVQQRFTWVSSAGPVSLVVRNYGGVKLTDLANVKALNDIGRME